MSSSPTSSSTPRSLSTSRTSTTTLPTMHQSCANEALHRYFEDLVSLARTVLRPTYFTYALTTSEVLDLQDDLNSFFAGQHEERESKDKQPKCPKAMRDSCSKTREEDVMLVHMQVLLRLVQMALDMKRGGVVWPKPIREYNKEEMKGVYQDIDDLVFGDDGRGSEVEA